jgi:hypothetical protein
METMRAPATTPLPAGLAGRLTRHAERGRSHRVKFMLIHYIDQSLLRFDADGREIEDPEETRIRDAWDKEMTERGILVGGGILDRPGATTTLRVRDGEVLVTDGPFAETKEQIAGYAVLECSDLAEAIEISARHPTGAYGTFELRRYLY